jgi:predicted acyltransferase
MTMAGIATSVIYFGAYQRKSLRVRIQFGLAAGLLTLTAGWFLIPLGISKLRRTPTWSLFSIGAAILLFTALHFICDVKRRTAWAKFAHSASTNTLTTYLIPDVWAYILGAAGIIYFGKHLNMGWPGAVWAAIFTAIVVVIATVLTRLRVRLRL